MKTTLSILTREISSIRDGRLAFCLTALFLSAVPLFAVTTNVWNGGGADNNWSTAANWGGLPLASGSGNSLWFGNTNKTTSSNDLTGYVTSASAQNWINFSNATWNITGNQVIVTNTRMQNLPSGACTINWGTDISIAGSSSSGLGLYNNGTGANVTYNLTGAISGPGYIYGSPGSSGSANVYLRNTNNSFTGRIQNLCGNVYIYSLAPVGTNCSLGAGASPSYYLFGAPNTASVLKPSLNYLGAQDAVTDRKFVLAGTNGVLAAINNNSPSNASLTFNAPGYIDVTNAPNSTLTAVFGGTSTGTNTINAQIGEIYTTNNVSVTGPGTWVFNNVVYLVGSLSVDTNSHLVLGYTNTFSKANILFNSITVNSGGTLDVSAYDQNGSTFVLGEYSGYPETLTAGRTGTPATDINGSLSMAGSAAASLNVAGIVTPGTLTISSNFIPANGTIQMNVGASTNAGSGVSDLIQVGGNLDLSQGTANIVLTPLAPLQLNTPYTLMTYSGSLIGNASGLSVPAFGRNYSAGVVSTATPGVVTVTFTTNGAAIPNPMLWKGYVNTNWDMFSTANWSNNVTLAADVCLPGDNVMFNDASSVTNVTLVGSIAPSTTTFSNVVNHYTLSGSGSIVSGSLLKQGSGVMTMNNANTYAGGTVITAGTLEINNASGTSGLGAGPVTVNAGGTLAGMGYINNGTNSVVLNGTISVGNIGRTRGEPLSVTNTGGLIINSGGGVMVSLFSGAGQGNNSSIGSAADWLYAKNIPVTINPGAVLTVNNPSNMVAWAAGDKWGIFSWTTTNRFTTFNLPTLPAGLIWDTSGLTNGTLAVAIAAPTQSAQILGAFYSNGSLILKGTNNNVPNTSFHYEVLSSTNLAVQLTNWTVLATNNFNANGTFYYTNIIDATKPAMFFDTIAVP
jgi:autotransporter-associated beta strand protein